MKRGGILFLCLFFVVSLLPPVLSADEATQNLVSRILESFDPADKAREWYVQGSKFVTEGYPELAYAQSWPYALFGNNREGNDYQVLGIHAKFDRQGYNYIEIIPVKREGGEVIPDPIPIPGRVKEFDLWVWGTRFDYYLELYLEDYKGIVHVLDLGNMNFTGWKNLRIQIPSYIPQLVEYIPYLKGLELLKIVLWTRPYESVSDFYMYIDQIKVLTDMFVSRFDGDDLALPEKVSEVWSEGGE